MSEGSAAVVGPDGQARCPWGLGPPDLLVYHDEEWGKPVTDDTGIFERLSLEGFQSGLSWLTILRKRENFRVAFAGFDRAWWPGSVRPTWIGFSPTRGSCATGRRSRP